MTNYHFVEGKIDIEVIKHLPLSISNKGLLSVPFTKDPRALFLCNVFYMFIALIHTL